MILVLTLKPFVEQMEADLSLRFSRLVADAGYESEENLKYLEEKRIMAFIKPANYEQIGTKKFEAQIGKKENMRYDSEQDCYVCHNQKKIRKTNVKQVKTASGYLREETHYRCSECDGCPYREKCMPGKNWKKPVSERYKHLVVVLTGRNPSEKLEEYADYYTKMQKIKHPFDRGVAARDGSER